MLTEAECDTDCNKVGGVHRLAVLAAHIINYITLFWLKKHGKLMFNIVVMTRNIFTCSVYSLINLP